MIGRVRFSDCPFLKMPKGPVRMDHFATTRRKRYVRRVRAAASGGAVQRFDAPPGHQGKVDFADFRMPWGKRRVLIVVPGPAETPGSLLAAIPFPPWSSVGGIAHLMT